MTFPIGPEVGQTHTIGARTWVWDGGRWLGPRSAPSVTLDDGTLATALIGAAPKLITVSGRHTGPATGWQHTRSGTSGAPIRITGTGTLQPHPERESGSVLSLQAAHVHVDSLTIIDPADSPESRLGPSAANTRPTAVSLGRDNESARHMTLLDVGNGFSSSTHLNDGLIYGSVVLDNGWFHTDRGHGHGMYLQHTPGGLLTVRHNVVGYTAADGVKTAGDAGDASDIAVVENTVVYPNERDTANGTLTAFNHYSRDNSSQGVLWDGNWSIVSGNRNGYWIGWQEKSPIDQDFTITNAWHHGGTAIRLNYPWESVTVTDSTLCAGPDGYFYTEGNAGTEARTFSGIDFYGGKAKPFRLDGGPDLTYGEWVDATGATDCTYHPDEEPPARTEVLHDDYIDGRAIVRVWNPDEDPTVTVDTGLDGPWELRDALNPQAYPVARGTGSTVTVPMTGLRLRKPAGLDELPHPAPRFGVFLLLPG